MTTVAELEKEVIEIQEHLDRTQKGWRDHLPPQPEPVEV